MEGVFNRKCFFALLVSVTIVKCAYGQTCQESLPSQYNPMSDSLSTTMQSTRNTFYLYPGFFNTAQCAGSTMNIRYEFCYLYVRTSANPDDVFTVLILSDEGSVYRILHSYTESEDRDKCTDRTPCCKTASLAVTLNIQRDLALGFVIPGDTGGNALYMSNTAMSQGFVESRSVVQSTTGIGSTIEKASFSGDRQQINNQRFSIIFETEPPTTTTTYTGVTSGSGSIGGAVAAGVIVTLLVVGAATAVAVVLVVLFLRKRHVQQQKKSEAHSVDGFDNQQVIEMKSNDAYIISQGLQIPTVENVAYNPIQSNSFNQPQLNIQHEYEYL